MKAKQIWKLAALAYLMLTLILIGCLEQGPMGPEGPRGPEGLQGPKADALQCMACHNSTTRVLAKQIEYQNSGHSKNGNFDRSTATCAGCHTAEGFMDRMAKKPAVDIVYPTPVSCYACHFVHNNYDSTDFKLRIDSTATVNFRLTDSTKSYSYGKGNVCASCHQPRRVGPALTATDSISVTGTYGPHYGTQSSMLQGVQGFQVPGALEYPTSPSIHAQIVKNTCVDCHMAAPSGDKTGGHQMGLVSINEENGVKSYNNKGCINCHKAGAIAGVLPTTGNIFNYKKAQDTITMYLTDLTKKLQTLKLLDTLSHPSPTAGKRTPLLAGILFNRSMVANDGSMGVHNYNYAKALLKNSLDTLNKLYPPVP